MADRDGRARLLWARCRFGWSFAGSHPEMKKAAFAAFFIHSISEAETQR
jgi:hypothetical protein